MRSRHEQKIKDGARPFLDEGEEVLVAFVARPRGWTQAGAGHAGPGAAAAELGGSSQARNYAAAEQAGFRIASPMALALTATRLLVFELSSPWGLGLGGRVKRLVSAAPLADVDSIAVRRLLIGRVVTLTVRGVSFRLEANELADAKGLARKFHELTAGA